MAIKELKQQNFWDGITNDIRSTSPNSYWHSENLDIVGKSLRQVVNNQAENACSYDVNNYITREIQVGTQIYGLGQDNNTNHDTTIWTKTNALDGAWSIPANGTVAATTFRAGYSLFASLNGVIYFDPGNDKIGTYTIATNTMSATWKSLVGGLQGGTIWQGRIYGWNGQKIYAIDPVANTLTDMKTVSNDQTIIELVPYGNLLAVVCSSTVTTSKMYLWDGVSTTTWSEILEIGYGTVSGGALLEGSVVVAISTPNKRTLKLKAYNGGDFRNLFTYTARPNQAGTYNYVLPASRLKTFTGYIYFIITGTKPDGTYAGLYEYAIARFGREEPINPLTFTIYKTFDFTSARGLDGQTANNDFTILENIVGGSTTEERSVAAVINSDTNKTTFFLSSTSTYTAQAGVMETVKISGGDSSIIKQLKSVSVQYQPLPTAGQVVMKYRTDENLTWTTIFTDTTDNAISHEATSIEATGENFPQFKEIQFRFELIGGAELIGYKVKWEDTAQGNY